LALPFLPVLLAHKARQHQATGQNAEVFEEILSFMLAFQATEIPKIMQAEIDNHNIERAAIGREAQMAARQ
jgi:hypothetical protein